MSRVVSAKEAAEYYGASISNVRKWAREGKVEVRTTPGGHYKYILPPEKTIETKNDKEEWKENIVYCRVSSVKQSSDLDRQCKLLQDKYPEFTVVSDIGSGIDYKRKNFQSILELLYAGKVKRVVVAHSDRFSRFGFDFFQWMFTQFGAVLESVESPNPIGSAELVDDIMEVFTTFTTRYYGKRRYNKKDKVLADSESDSSDE
jgi:predicted site-specific integrase-resolvase